MKSFFIRYTVTGTGEERTTMFPWSSKGDALDYCDTFGLARNSRLTNLRLVTVIEHETPLEEVER